MPDQLLIGFFAWLENKGILFDLCIVIHAGKLWFFTRLNVPARLPIQAAAPVHYERWHSYFWLYYSVVTREG